MVGNKTECKEKGAEKELACYRLASVVYRRRNLINLILIENSGIVLSHGFKKYSRS